MIFENRVTEIIALSSLFIMACAAAYVILVVVPVKLAFEKAVKEKCTQACYPRPWHYDEHACVCDLMKEIRE